MEEGVRKAAHGRPERHEEGAEEAIKERDEKI